ncbi:transposase zinc-binding domain-containing protein [Bdellovibrio sp. HCB288]|uniref:transposase zinc-binding domain-containing protein n=1 Tax=Bdellovibrio sp. HCB288 TaxID=3394355 RepID=UPI0039B6495C
MVAAVPYIHNKSYRRHRPEQNLLYRKIETYWPIFLKEQQRVGKALPHFVRDEFDGFLECGIPENGFVRVYCYGCRHSGIIPFSCKRRGFCPSCCARRMNDEAAHLVDAVIPEIPVRQWVLSFPFKMRFLMARNQGLMNKALKIYITEIQSFQRKRAKGVGSAT